MKGWKTIVFNLVLALLGVLETTNWVDVIPENWAGVVMLIVGALGLWLRGLTTTPVGKK